MKRKAFLIDITECVGCGACYEACKEQNNLPQTSDDPLRDTLSDKTYTIIEQRGDYFVRRMCQHCEEPTCVSVCPVGAFIQTDFGAVLYDESKCFGCRYCMQACPFQIPRYEWGSLKPRVQKCIMCYDRVKNGELPACAEACPTGATLFGDRDEMITIAGFILHLASLIFSFLQILPLQFHSFDLLTSKIQLATHHQQ